MTNQQLWLDFTRANYRRLTAMAMERYRLVPVSEWEQDGAVAVWRHDVDLSPQAAIAFARIEASAGVRATYYFSLRSEFYQVLERSNVAIVRELVALGHEIGLHFDASAYDLSDEADLERALTLERDALATLLGIDLKSFSFHNPGVATAGFKATSYSGLANAYGSDLLSRYAYCSDSNGYWRFTPLEEFLGLGHRGVYVLTHPEWWQEEPMSPRERVVRCVEGRSAATLRSYDEQLERDGRRNIR